DFFFVSSRRRHTRFSRDWSSDVSLPISGERRGNDRSAAISACGLPAPRWKPLARAEPAASTMTQPTRGLPPADPPRSASVTAWSIAAVRASARVVTVVVTSVLLPLGTSGREGGCDDAKLRLRTPVGAHRRRTAGCRRRHVLTPIRTVTVGPGVPPGPPFTLAGVRVADCHRRFGLSPTPEHVLARRR